MAGDSTKDLKDVAEIAGNLPATTSEERKKKKKKERGVLSRLWNGLFRLHGDDFEKRLQHISKEEAAILARLKRRSISRRRMTRNLIVFSVLFEVIYVEACESGSIFEGLMPKDLNIYVQTASRADENSWGTYCPGMEPSPPPEYM